MVRAALLTRLGVAVLTVALVGTAGAGLGLVTFSRWVAEAIESDLDDLDEET